MNFNYFLGFDQTFRRLDSMKQKILQGGVTFAVQMAPNLQLHYFGEVIELTDNQQKIKATYHRVGRWIE